MTYRKRLLCLGLVLIFAVSLTACGQSRSGTDVPTTAASTQGSQSEQEEPAEPTADAEPTAGAERCPLTAKLRTTWFTTGSLTQTAFTAST